MGGEKRRLHISTAATCCRLLAAAQHADEWASKNEIVIVFWWNILMSGRPLSSAASASILFETSAFSKNGNLLLTVWPLLHTAEKGTVKCLQHYRTLGALPRRPESLVLPALTCCKKHGYGNCNNSRRKRATHCVHGELL